MKVYNFLSNIIDLDIKITPDEIKDYFYRYTQPLLLASFRDTRTTHRSIAFLDNIYDIINKQSILYFKYHPKYDKHPKENFLFNLSFQNEDAVENYVSYVIREFCFDQSTLTTEYRKVEDSFKDFCKNTQYFSYLAVVMPIKAKSFIYLKHKLGWDIPPGQAFRELSRAAEKLKINTLYDYFEALGVDFNKEISELDTYRLVRYWIQERVKSPANNSNLYGSFSRFRSYITNGWLKKDWAKYLAETFNTFPTWLYRLEDNKISHSYRLLQSLQKIKEDIYDIPTKYVNSLLSDIRITLPLKDHGEYVAIYHDPTGFIFDVDIQEDQILALHITPEIFLNHLEVFDAMNPKVLSEKINSTPELANNDSIKTWIELKLL